MGKAGVWMVDKYRAFRKFCGKPPVSAERIRRLRKLYPSGKPEEVSRRLDGKRIFEAAVVFITGSVLCISVLWFRKDLTEVKILERPDYGEEEAVYELEAQRENGERLSVELALPERSLGREEVEKLLEEAYEEVCGTMLGENRSAWHVDQDLPLPDEALGGLVSVEWLSRSPEIFNDWGELKKRPGERPEEGEKGIYELSLICGDYSSQYEMELTVFPPDQTEEARLKETVETGLRKKAEEGREEENFELPTDYEGERFTWFLKEDGEFGCWILWVLFMVCLLLVFRGRQQEIGKLKDREREMLMDYPELVSKFTVLLQAGLAARNVWERMAEEYEAQKKSGKKPRYAYEEMCITRNQMKNGMYESRAYGEFGRRCGLHAYMKFGALLEQNLRQGTAGLSLRLKEEAEFAFEERKNLARRLGEEAETRMMLPMFMMLAMVLTVIMAPAFLSF